MNVVRKYGKSCIDSADKLERIAEDLSRVCGGGEIPIAVVRTWNAGTSAAAQILVDGLKRRGISAVRIEGTSDPGNFPMDRLEQALADGSAVVAECPEERLGGADSGRLGAETLAVTIAAQLGLDCEFYCDVDCIYTVDPKLYPAAKRLDVLTYEEMMELSALGTGALEAGSVDLARCYDVRIFIGKVLETDHSRGTYIMNDSMYMKDMAVTGITAADDYTIFTLRELEDDINAISELFDLLGEMEINVDMISKQTGENGMGSISFSCIGSAAPNLEEALSERAAFAKSEVLRQENVVMISLVGAGMAVRSGVAGKVFSVLRREGIPCFQITTSEISISLAVPKECKERAIGAFGRAFDL